MEPAGNELPPVLMSNTSLPLPVFLSVFVNDTTEPCSAFATVCPVNVTDADWLTVNGALFVKNGPTLPAPSKYAKRAVLPMTWGARPAFTFTSNVTLPDWPDGTWFTIAVTAPGVATLKSKRIVLGPTPCVSDESASESTVAPVLLQRALPGTYVMPAGTTSVRRTLPAVALPEFVYVSV